MGYFENKLINIYILYFINGLWLTLNISDHGMHLIIVKTEGFTFYIVGNLYMDIYITFII